MEDWSAWSECTKGCGRGSRYRTKSLLSEAEGDGWCPSDESDMRFEREDCNPEPCDEVKTKDGLVKCNSSVDVVLLLDASGSVQEEGWKKTQVFGANLARSFQSVGKVAALEYSGPEDFSYYRDCKKGQHTPAECGCTWLSELTEDTEAVAKSIEGAPWKKGSTLTSMALSMAQAELAKNGQAKEKIVLLITDGKPLSKTSTEQKAMELRKVARLMIATVGEKAPRDLAAHWATQPARENLFLIEDFETLNDNIVNTIVENACQSVIYNDDSVPLKGL